jgi:putative hemolysin
MARTQPKRSLRRKRTPRFRLDPLLSRLLPRPLATLLAPPLEHLLALRRLDQIYDEIGPTGTPAQFARRALTLLDVRFSLPPGALQRIPTSGPLVVVANHPYGGVEGMFLISLLSRLRPDVRVMANELLTRITELAPAVLPVDVFGGPGAAARNARMLRDALRHVQQGGALVVFPAGEVAHVQAPGGVVTDPPWQTSIARLIQLSGAPVLPMFFEGANGAAFQAASRVHPRVRTALLPRELLARRHGEICVQVGRLIPAATCAAIEDVDALARHLRLATYALSATTSVVARTAKRSLALETVPAPEPPAVIAAEIAALPPEAELVASGDLAVYRLTRSQAPQAVLDIGRLREIAFRGVGEGTGASRDLDAYDDYYEHLVLWNRQQREIAGGYRMGDVASVRKDHGVTGLYTHTLFEYRARLLRAIDPALELGRSFIRPEYQRSFTPLLLLWKAIATHVAADARFRYLLGPVSLSDSYSTASKLLITEYLRAAQFEAPLARLVRGRAPLRLRETNRLLAQEAAAIADIETLDRAVMALEPDGKGVPVLLRQYLRLGGRVIGYNVDAAFGHAIDCLIVVDLERTPPALLAKYMGRDAAARYIELRGGVPRSGHRAA